MKPSLLIELSGIEITILTHKPLGTHILLIELSGIEINKPENNP